MLVRSIPSFGVYTATEDPSELLYQPTFAGGLGSLRLDGTEPFRSILEAGTRIHSVAVADPDLAYAVTTRGENTARVELVRNADGEWTMAGSTTCRADVLAFASVAGLWTCFEQNQQVVVEHWRSGQVPSRSLLSGRLEQFVVDSRSDTALCAYRTEDKMVVAGLRADQSVQESWELDTPIALRAGEPSDGWLSISKDPSNHLILLATPGGVVAAELQGDPPASVMRANRDPSCWVLSRSPSDGDAIKLLRWGGGGQVVWSDVGLSSADTWWVSRETGTLFVWRGDRVTRCRVAEGGEPLDQQDIELQIRVRASVDHILIEEAPAGRDRAWFWGPRAVQYVAPQSDETHVARFGADILEVRSAGVESAWVRTAEGLHLLSVADGQLVSQGPYCRGLVARSPTEVTMLGRGRSCWVVSWAEAAFVTQSEGAGVVAYLDETELTVPGPTAVTMSIDNGVRLRLQPGHAPLPSVVERPEFEVPQAAGTPPLFRSPQLQISWRSARGDWVDLEAQRIGDSMDWLLSPAESAPIAGSGTMEVRGLLPGELHFCSRYTVRITDGIGPLRRAWEGIGPVSRTLLLALAVALVLGLGGAAARFWGGGRNLAGWSPLTLLLIADAVAWAGTLEGIGIQPQELTAGLVIGTGVLMVSASLHPAAANALMDCKPLQRLAPLLLLLPRQRRLLLAPYRRLLRREIASLAAIRHSSDYMNVPLQSTAWDAGYARRLHSDPVSEIVRLTGRAEGEGCRVLIRGPGGTGKTSLLAEVLAHIASDLELGKGESRVPVLLSLHGEDDPLEVLAEKLESVLHPALVEVVVRNRDVVVCIDGAEGMMPALAKKAVSGSLGAFTQIWASRPTPWMEKALRSSGRLPFVAFDTENWSEDRLNAFVAEQPKLSDELRTACRNYDGTYSPLLVCLALQAEDRSIGSRQDLLAAWLRTLLRATKIDGQSSDERIRDCAAWCYENYGKDGQRRFSWPRVRGNPAGRMMIEAGIICPSIEPPLGDPLEGRFVHDELQTFLTALAISEQPVDSWRGELERILKDGRFWDADVQRRQVSSLTAMCCEVLRPTVALCAALAQIARSWKDELVDRVSLTDLTADVSDIRARRNTPTHVVYDEVVKLFETSEDCYGLARLLENLARKLDAVPD